MTPTAALIRHFIANAAGRAWLDDEGIAGLRSVFFFAVAGLGTLGLFLPRRFSRVYLQLEGAGPVVYAQALFADSLFMLSLPAIVAGGLAIVLAPSMFPDETDYVALGALPLTRRQLFGAKLLALAIIVSAIIGAMIVLFGIAFPAYSHTRWAAASQPARILAHTTAAAASATFAVLAVMALQGAMLLAVPRRWLAAVTAAVQSLLLGGLVLTVPFVFGALTARAWLATDPPVLFAAPPAWFLGLQQVLLGSRDPFELRLAAVGVVALAAAAGVAAASYLLLYRRVESLLAPADRDRTAGRRRRRGRAARPAPWRAVWAFTFATLARSRQSQMLFMIVWAAGAAIAVNVVLRSDPGSWLANAGRSRAAVGAAVIAPLPLVVLGLLGARAAFLLPVQPRANWIFRILDLPERRAGHLAAVERALFALGVLPALVVCAPLEVAALGADHAGRVLVLAAGVGLIVIEMMLANWRRIPFTCSYIPGKRPLPLLIMAVIGAVQAVTLATGLIFLALLSFRAFVVVAAVLFVPALALRWRRRRGWAALPLEFEDQLPDRVQTLDLSG